MATYYDKVERLWAADYMIYLETIYHNEKSSNVNGYHGDIQRLKGDNEG
jgi:hypothetical protein